MNDETEHATTPGSLVVTERHGSEIYDLDAYHEHHELVTLRRKSDVYEGRRVVTLWLTGEFVIAKIVKREDEFFLESSSSCGLLRYAPDDRCCWICVGWYNTEAASRVVFAETRS